MRQLKNCKVGHFVKYHEILCQVNCFFTNNRGKCATLITVGERHEEKRIYSVNVTEKVEYLGETATDEKGRCWKSVRRDPVKEWNSTH